VRVPTLDTLRLVLHVLAASVWVGGQIALAGVGAMFSGYLLTTGS